MVKRTDFSVESRLLGRDFEQVIATRGGKAAGIMLLETIAKKTFLMLPSNIPRHKSLPTTVHDLVADNIAARKDELQDFLQRPMPQYEENIQKIRAILELEPRFKQRIHRWTRALAKTGISKWHLRSSTTIEDWKDDRYFGTFRTEEVCFFPRQGARQGSLIGKDKYDRSLTDTIIDMCADFILKQQFRHTYAIADEERFGVLGMPTVDAPIHVTIYSSYPEKKSDTAYIEVSRNRNSPSWGDTYEAVQLIQVTPSAVNIFQSHDTTQLSEAEQTWFEMCSPFSVSGTRSPLHKQTILNIYRRVQHLQDMLQKPVNLEALIDYDSTAHEQIQYVQLRPVPALDPSRPVKELGPLQEEYQLLATTPFVHGSFRIEAPVVMKEKESGHRPYMYPSPIILIDDNQFCKGHRSYLKDSNVQALISTATGIAISHQYAITPSFTERAWQHHIGLPHFPQLLDKLYTIRWKDGQRTDEAKVSKFPFIIESDGREGRIYIRKEYVEEYETIRPPLFGDRARVKQEIGWRWQRLKEDSFPF